MKIKTNCELCGKEVLLTSSYKGQPIICLDCDWYSQQIGDSTRNERG